MSLVLKCFIYVLDMLIVECVASGKEVLLVVKKCC